MKTRTGMAVTVVAMVAVGMAAEAWGALVITPQYTILTGLKDITNIDIPRPVVFGGSLTTAPGDADVYLNSVALVPGAGYNPTIGITVPVGTLTYGGIQQYTMGTPISADTQFFGVQGAALPGVSVAASVAPGIYPFAVEFRGGSSAAANDLLGTWNLQLEVFDRLEATATGTATPGTIGYGETTSVSVTLTNNMASRSLVTTSAYYAGGGMEQGPARLSGSFAGNWFNQTILPGGSRTANHTNWTADSLTLPTGTYVGHLGVFAGLHNGDSYGIRATSPVPSVELVPEPSGAGVLGIGIIAGMTRARRRKTR